VNQDPLLNADSAKDPQEVSAKVDWIALEDLIDKFLSKREQFYYFLITAATAVVTFSFGHFNAPEGILRHSPLWLLGLGWGSLIVCAGSSLLGIRERLNRYGKYVEVRKAGRFTPTQDEDRALRESEIRLRVAGIVSITAFVIGMFFLIAAYSVALVRFPDPPVVPLG
jgi:hypothetical protein